MSKSTVSGKLGVLRIKLLQLPTKISSILFELECINHLFTIRKWFIQNTLYIYLLREKVRTLVPCKNGQYDNMLLHNNKLHHNQQHPKNIDQLHVSSQRVLYYWTVFFYLFTFFLLWLIPVLLDNYCVFQLTKPQIK